MKIKILDRKLILRMEFPIFSKFFNFKKERMRKEVKLSSKTPKCTKNSEEPSSQSQNREKKPTNRSSTIIIPKEVEIEIKLPMVLPQDISIPDCPLVSSLPKELWLYNIFSFLTKHDLAAMRLICRWARKFLVIYPIWKQWIPFEQINVYQGSYHQLGWSDASIHACYFVKGSLLNKEVNIMKTLPSTLKELDLSNCEQSLKDEHFMYLPTSLEKLILSWNSVISKSRVDFILTIYPNLNITFGGITNNSTNSILFWSCYKGYLDMVQFLLSKPKELNNINHTHGSTGTTPLYISTLNKHSGVVELLLQYGADINKARTDNGTTPLFIASANGHKEIVNILLEHGADVNLTRRDNGWTPLFVASFNGHVDIVFSLLKYNPDANKTDIYGKTAHYYAQLQKSTKYTQISNLIQTYLEKESFYY